MKNLLLAVTTLFILSSCDTNEMADLQNPDQVSKTEVSKNSASKNTGATLSSIANKNVTCAGGGGSMNPIFVNPNYPYISNYSVAYRDYTALFGRNQTTLSKFVLDNVFISFGTTPNFIQLIYGNNMAAQTEYANTNSSNLSEMYFIIGQNSDNAAVYGDMFNSDPNQPGFMSNDAANTVLHGFKQNLQNNNLLPSKIKAVQVYTDALLCIPGFKFIRMNVRYQQ
ncbi:hypothetical protein [Chryseobacterium herbae]|uniref:Uncharacterized protein n=1 Tax=Chryseobacterium herbae TaxID=2976476 RepID=A0ABT2IUV4_9FLAO|nr:hypothetical protein [Chryseobacterium sp. pc1-10]MCT2562623.1 hypothetical protein [Chryseobacterium sp. pc1-10]